MRAHRPGITHQRLLTWIAIGHILAITAIHAAPQRRPQIGPEMAGPERFELRAAYKAAIKMLDRDANCRALFDDLILDGPEALGRSRYQQPRSAPEQARCARGVAAATAVGRSEILICRRFHTLRRPSKIAIVIHEALHTAGLSELPHDPAGKTSREINEMVKKACSLGIGTN